MPHQVIDFISQRKINCKNGPSPKWQPKCYMYSTPKFGTIPSRQRKRARISDPTIMATWMAKRPWLYGWSTHHVSSLFSYLILYTYTGCRYIVDGNAVFLTATETAWRRATSSQYSGGGIIVATGYPSLHEKLYNMQRRSFDLTPPQPTTSTTPIAGRGGANALLNFIESAVKPAVKARFPQVTVTREALFGHSYGGLFALHALFTRPELFDCYIASSPSIWWNDRFIEQEAATFFLKSNMNSPSRPSLMVFWGSLEQDAPCTSERSWV